MALSELLIERITYVSQFIGDSTDNWNRIKLEIIHSLPAKQRRGTGIGVRHKQTKKFILTQTDVEIMNLWEELTGVKPVIDPKTLHDPTWMKCRTVPIHKQPKYLAQVSAKKSAATSQQCHQ